MVSIHVVDSLLLPAYKYIEILEAPQRFLPIIGALLAIVTRQMDAQAAAVILRLLLSVGEAI